MITAPRLCQIWYSLAHSALRTSGEKLKFCLKCIVKKYDNKGKHDSTKSRLIQISKSKVSNHAIAKDGLKWQCSIIPVSYTHLTLPTNREV